MAYYTMPTNAVDPQAVRLLDESSASLNPIDGQIRLPYDFSTSPWAADANFYTTLNATDSFLDQSKIDALAAKLRDGGYNVMEAGDSVGNGTYRWVQDAQGNIVAEPQYTTNNDPNFLAAMIAAGAFAGGSAAGLASPGGAAAAAPSGSSGGLLGGEAGFGGFSGSLTGDIGAQYGLGSLGAESAAGLVAPGAAGSGGALLAAPGASSGFGSLGSFTSQIGNLGGSAPGAPSAPGGSTLGEMGSGLLDFAKANPKLIGGLLGGALGGLGSSDSGSQAYNGPMPTITRGNWSPTATPQMMAAPSFGSRPLPTTGNVNSGLWRYRG